MRLLCGCNCWCMWCTRLFWVCYLFFCALFPTEIQLLEKFGGQVVMLNLVKKREKKPRESILAHELECFMRVSGLTAGRLWSTSTSSWAPSRRCG
jgi:hypothetical protein